MYFVLDFIFNKVDLLLDFNDMSACQGLFYAKRIKNCLHSIFRFTFFSEVSLKHFAHCYISSIPI